MYIQARPGTLTDGVLPVERVWDIGNHDAHRCGTNVGAESGHGELWTYDRDLYTDRPSPELTDAIPTS